MSGRRSLGYNRSGATKGFRWQRTLRPIAGADWWRICEYDGHVGGPFTSAEVIDMWRMWTAGLPDAFVPDKMQYYPARPYREADAGQQPPGRRMS